MNDQAKRFGDEYRRQLYDRLEKRSKSFTTLFRATTIFALAFLAFILIPLVGLQHDEKKIKAILKQYERKKQKLDEKVQQIGTIQSKLDHFSSLLEKKKNELTAKAEEVEEMNSRLEQIELQIDKNTSKFNLNKEKAVAFTGIRSQFKALPAYNTRRSAQKLRNSLAKIGSGLGSSQDLSKLPENDRCRTATDINAYVKCKTRETIQVHLEAYRSVIEKAGDELTGPVALDGRRRIDDRITQVLAVLERKLSEKPDFWHSYRGKTFFFAEFEKPMEDVFNEISHQLQQYKDALDDNEQEIFNDDKRLSDEGRRLEKLLADKKQYRAGIADKIGEIESEILKLNPEYEKLQSELELVTEAITPLKKTIDSLKQTIDKIPEAKRNIEARLENVQTPFGTLPLGLNEALLVFPILIATGFLMCCSMLVELMRLRSEYHQATRKQFPGDAEEIDGGIQLVAPIWLDPIADKRSFGGRLALLSLPTLAYSVGLGLILYSWYLGGTPPGSTRIMRNGYLLMYLLGIAGFVIAAGRIRVEWRRYRSLYFSGNNEGM